VYSSKPSPPRYRRNKRAESEWTPKRKRKRRATRPYNLSRKFDGFALIVLAAELDQIDAFEEALEHGVQHHLHFLLFGVARVHKLAGRHNPHVLALGVVRIS
jgi:hypothetical protein